jgi:putative DNA primase/helicase
MTAPENPILAAALAYAGAGLPVFPCSPRPEKGVGKRPLVPPETAPGAKDGGLYLATTDEAQIRAWWRQYPGALIGMPTGLRAGVVVVDLDPRSFEAGDMLDALETWIGGEAFDGPIVRTQSGGLHLWFRYPDDLGDVDKIGNRAGLFGKVEAAPTAIRDYVDVRGEGGYVILPPSAMTDGKRYEWRVDLADTTLPDLPRRLFEVITKTGEFARAAARPASPATPLQVAPTHTRAGDWEAESVHRYGLAALDKAAGRVQAAREGTRNQTINDEALAIGHLVGAGALSRAVAHAALFNACLAWGIPADDKAIRPGGTLDRALDAGARSPADLSDVRQAARDRAAKAAARRPPPAMPSDYDLDPAPRRGSETPAPGPQPGSVGAGGDYDAPADEGAEDQGPSASGAEVDDAIVAECASLDHSDTDNATRLIAHFGRDLAVLAQDEATGGTWLGWTGTHWDLAAGAAMARLTAQKLGHCIGLEADHLAQTLDEQKAIEAAKIARPSLAKLKAKPVKDWSGAEHEAAAALQDQIDAAEAARDALAKRKKARRSFGVSSKNRARIEAMLELSAPRLRRPADSFNANRFRVACQSHTLTFDRVLDEECPDPDAQRWVGQVDALRGHARDHWLTAVLPCGYDPAARAPRWRSFLEAMLPDAEKRRTVQAFTGLGLLGVPVQYLMFHYGRGANGKSVFLETITRVLGPGLAVGLPRESIVGGGERGAGSATPDLVRLYGKRFVRILEVPGDAPLQEDLIKRLTGGESFPVRTLFKGYFEFQNCGKAHMSGNGFPTVDGTDNGIWRRLLVVHWDQTIPEPDRRDFEAVVSEFVAEAPGVLNWLIEGVFDYLENGLVIAPAVRAATQEYREEMDPIGEFIGACIEAKPGARIGAQPAYEAYISWSLANARKPKSITKFGKVMTGQYEKQVFEGRNFYLDVDLHDVPERPIEHGRAGAGASVGTPPAWATSADGPEPVY